MRKNSGFTAFELAMSMAIVVIIAALAIFSVAVGEDFCNCAGLGWKTPKPTYYVYRPTGDVSNYGADYLSQEAQGQFMTVGSQPVIYPELVHGQHALVAHRRQRPRLG